MEKYETQSIHYLENAFSFLRGGDVEKASEFLWGSIAEAIKAVAVSKGIVLESHDELRTYTRELAKALGDKSIWDAFYHANSLHSNFYESRLKLEEVDLFAQEVRAAVGKLFRLLPKGEPSA